MNYDEFISPEEKELYKTWDILKKTDLKCIRCGCDMNNVRIKLSRCNYVMCKDCHDLLAIDVNQEKKDKESYIKYLKGKKTCINCNKPFSPMGRQLYCPECSYLRLHNQIKAVKQSNNK